MGWGAGNGTERLGDASHDSKEEAGGTVRLQEERSFREKDTENLKPTVVKVAKLMLSMLCRYIRSSQDISVRTSLPVRRGWFARKRSGVERRCI